MKTNSILKPAHPENQICSDNVRISILEPRLIRFEWSKNGLFEDRKTQNVTCRNFGAVHFLQKEKDNGMEIDTGALKIFIGKSSNLLGIIPVFHPIFVRMHHHIPCLYSGGSFKGTVEQRLKILPRAIAAVPVEGRMRLFHRRTCFRTAQAPLRQSFPSLLLCIRGYSQNTGIRHPGRSAAHGQRCVFPPLPGFS